MDYYRGKTTLMNIIKIMHILSIHRKISYYKLHHLIGTTRYTLENCIKFLEDFGNVEVLVENNKKYVCLTGRGEQFVKIYSDVITSLLMSKTQEVII